MRAIRLNRQVLEVKPSKNYAEVLLFGDFHLGSPQCDKERAQSNLDYCLKNGVYVFLMGDLIENAGRHSIGAAVYEQEDIAQTQYERIVEMLKPLANAGLILGSLTGNHEDRTYKECGVDVMALLCRELKIPYLGWAGWSRFLVGRQSYTMYALHGSSGAKFVYTKLKSLVDISHSFACDLLAMGHVHDCADASQLVQVVDPRSKTVVERKKFVVITGHYLAYQGGYAQAKGLPLSKLGSPKVKFFSDHHDIHVSW